MDLRSPETSFLGAHINKIDAKGRVAVPADFRRALEGGRLNGFYCLPALKGDYLQCGGGDLIISYKEFIQRLELFSDEREALEEHLLGTVRPLSFDTEGRVVIPESFRLHASLTDRARFEGRGETFLIMRDDGAEERREKTRDLALAALVRLRNSSSNGRQGE